MTLPTNCVNTMKIRTYSDWLNSLDRPYTSLLGEITVHKRSKFDDWCSTCVPYWPILFITKRQRVKLRSYFRHHWLNKVNKKITKEPSKVYASPPDFSKIETELPLEWEITYKNE